MKVKECMLTLEDVRNEDRDVLALISEHPFWYLIVLNSFICTVINYVEVKKILRLRKAEVTDFETEIWRKGIREIHSKLSFVPLVAS